MPELPQHEPAEPPFILQAVTLVLWALIFIALWFIV